MRQFASYKENQLSKRRVQYPKEFKLSVISCWRDANAKGVSKYAVAERLRISEKMLRKWIAKESDTLIQRNEQQKGTTGRVASLPQMKDYLHEQFLKLRV